MNDGKDNLVKDMITRNMGVLTGFTWQPFAGVFPLHRLPTVYQYNSLNQVVHQYSPDGDTSEFFYDRLGRLTVSQNREQKENTSYSGAADRFSYTKYDGLGRITEVGEKSDPPDDIHTINMLDTTAVKDWLAGGIDKQLTKTIYDIPVNLELQAYSSSRKRVTASIYLENKNDTEGDSTIYSYDINGNVKTLLQHVKALVAVDATNGKKRVDYNYDLVSGKVNMVSYQHGKGDQFYYKYDYDADNRVVRSLSSRDKLIWTEDASYTYYLHGPLARTELGQYKVQGTDYAYTLQGWLKGINGSALDPAKEMGQDGKSATLFARVSRDVYGFSLGCYNNDYTPVGTGADAFAVSYTPTTPVSSVNSGNQLFNGNISYTTLALSKIRNGSMAGYTYNYDQLNRLTEMNRHNIDAGASTWNNSSIIAAYKERISYDANGNILKYLRNGGDTTGLPLDMDSLGYKYNRDVNGNLVNNRLNHVQDAVTSSNYTVDIDNQSANNYGYDRIGNLKTDVAEKIGNINWTVYGKIKQVDKNEGSDIAYGYDAGGNRTSKIVSGAADTTTFYIRDAQGNVLAIYSKKGAESLRWDEQHLYGSSRLGMWRWDTLVPTAAPVVGGATSIYDSLLLGSRSYELSNHLGNVLSTISDKKIGIDDGSGGIAHYIAEVLSQNDYYPFGMQMPGRKYTAPNNSYRYGFNGKENDNEVKGEGNQQDYGMRIYDPRLGRFLSVDPLAKTYPWYTPYQFAGNKPIWAIDLDGAEEEIIDQQNREKEKAKLRNPSIEERVNSMVKKGHYILAVYAVINHYQLTELTGAKRSNFDIQIEEKGWGGLMQTSGDIEKDKLQTIKINKNDISTDPTKFGFFVRGVLHELLHVNQRTKENPNEDRPEREFLAYSTQLLTPDLPEQPINQKKAAVSFALTFYNQMSEEKQKKHKSLKDKLSDLISPPKTNSTEPKKVSDKPIELKKIP